MVLPSFDKKLGSLRYVSRRGKIHYAYLADDGSTVMSWFFEKMFRDVKAWVDFLDASESTEEVFTCDI
jgi:hypothetical protein